MIMTLIQMIKTLRNNTTNALIAVADSKRDLKRWPILTVNYLLQPKQIRKYVIHK